MLYIAESKIGTIRSKPNVKYPIIRLPQEYIQIIGQKAHICETNHDGTCIFSRALRRRKGAVNCTIKVASF